MQTAPNLQLVDPELAELSRVLASDCFARSTQLRKLLSYLAANSGAGSELTEYDVAREALGRRNDFDPSTDAIVRKEMGRLRRRLDTYYATEGRGSSLHVQLPKGGYAIRYARIAMMPTPAGPARRVQIAFHSLRPLGGTEPHFAELLFDDLLTALVRRPLLAIAAGSDAESLTPTLWGIVTQPSLGRYAIRLRVSLPVTSVILWQSERTFAAPITAELVESLASEVEEALEIHFVSPGRLHPAHDLAIASRSEPVPGHRN